MNRKSLSFVAIAVMVLSLAVAPVMGQKKGGGASGSGPLGRVFFQTRPTNSEPWITSFIRADGTGGAVPILSQAFDDARYLHEASHLLHGGQRWFLFSGTDFTSFSYLGALDETGAEVILFSSADFSFTEGAPHWMRCAGDRWISFEGQQWSTDPQTGDRMIVEEGIFKVQVDFDEDGSIIGGIADSIQLVLSTLPLAGAPHGHDWNLQRDLLFVVWDGGEYNSMWIADVSDPSLPLIVAVNTGSTNRVGSPSWSPESSRIAFNEATTGIVILTLANGRRQTIKSTATIGVARPQWSPSGAGIIYQKGHYGTSRSDIYRAAADGSGRTYLATGSALGWRE